MGPSRTGRTVHNGVLHVEVKYALCGGEGLCERICPQVFRVIGGVAVVTQNPIPRAAEAACREAAEHCPTGSIRIVSEESHPSRKRSK